MVVVVVKSGLYSGSVVEIYSMGTEDGGEVN